MFKPVKSHFELLKTIIRQDNINGLIAYLDKNPDLDLNQVYYTTKHWHMQEFNSGTREHNDYDEYEITLLHQAILKNAVKIAEELIRRGASVDIPAKITHVDQTVEYPDFNPYNGYTSCSKENEKEIKSPLQTKTCIALCNPKQNEMRELIQQVHSIDQRPIPTTSSNMTI